MKLQGKIKVINQTKEVGAKNFKVREVVITTNGEYPQHILIQFTQDKCELLDKFKVNQEVEINININGREWTNPEGQVKYFNSINGWAIKESSTHETLQNQNEPVNQEDNDDLPF